MATPPAVNYERYFEPLLKRAIDLMQTGQTPRPLYRQPVYPGERVANLEGPDIDRARQMLGQQQRFAGNMLGFVGPGLTALRQNRWEMSPETVMAVADNPFLEGQIDAVSRDVVRNLTERDLPGSARMAAGSGGLGGGRQIVRDAVLQRGAEDRIADISSQMRGDAYNRGLGIAAQQATADMNARNVAGQQMMDLARMGYGGLLPGAQASQNLALQQREVDQLGLGANRERWNERQNAEWNSLMRYQQLMGGVPMAPDVGFGVGQNQRNQLLGGALGMVGPAIGNMFGGDATNQQQGAGLGGLLGLGLGSAVAPGIGSLIGAGLGGGLGGLAGNLFGGFGGLGDAIGGLF